MLGDRSRAQARALAADLTTLPAVVLDTEKRLYPGNDAVTFQQPGEPTEVGAEAAPEAKYQYRSFGLRLLVHGGDAISANPP
ncbi:hypothetical protein ASD65_02115 [Microbacterium sp. Root61]|uniref:hypothetical protein n=1 Tax=Microbacterium sp. Root61 TaxID=1736570 RepID=UPI0006FDB8F9|nr:hypothetical protein [Microbacterium sp. Root61]KRA23346.1 hypothetical protein ASD65_02115 [Microbacterium sp. Root61]